MASTDFSLWMPRPNQWRSLDSEKHVEVEWNERHRTLDIDLYSGSEHSTNITLWFGDHRDDAQPIIADLISKLTTAYASYDELRDEG